MAVYACWFLINRFCYFYKNERGTNLSSIRRYLQFVKPYRLQIIGTVIIGIIKFSIPLIIPMLIKYVVDDIVGNHTLSHDEKINKLMLIMGVMIFVFVILRPPIEYYRQYFAQWTSSKILYDIRDTMYNHIQKLSFKYFQITEPGNYFSCN